MVLLNIGINKMRDAIGAIINESTLGSIGTEVLVSDTGIGSAIAGTTKTITVTPFNNGLKFEYTTDAGDGDGNIAREFIIDESGDNIALFRAVFPEIDIDSTTQIEINSQLLLIQEL